MVFDSIHVHLFLISNFDFSKNVIIFGAEIGSSTHADNKKNILKLLDKEQHKD